MISNLGLKRKSSSSSSSGDRNLSYTPVSTLTKRFRGLAPDGKMNQHEPRMSLLANTVKSESAAKKMNMINGDTSKAYKRLEESELTPAMLAEYRRLQHELQCQEALLVLMQKLKTNQRLVSQTNNNGLKQRATATKLNQQPAIADGKTPLTATKQQQQQQQPQPLATNNANRTTPTKPSHPNQYASNRPNPNSQLVGPSASKSTIPQAQATRQPNHASNHNSNNAALPAAATRLSSTVPASATKTSSIPSNASNASKSNGVTADQHLLNAKLALRKQLEQTLLQIPTPKPSTCDLTFIPGVNGWSEFLAFLGLEQAFNTHADIVNRRPPSDISMTMPHVCAQCGTDWSVTWHEMSSANDSNNSMEEKILCDRCTKTSQKKLLKQDHSNRLRQAFIKALQQEKELDAKFQHQSSTNTSMTTTTSTTSTTTTAPNPPSTTTTTSSMKQSSSSSSHAQPSSKHLHSSSKHSTKPVSTKNSSNHHHPHHNSSTSNNHNHHSHHHHHHHSSKSSSGSSKSHHNHTPSIPNLTQSPAETLASTLAALQTNEQMELFQKHFLSNMLPFAVANQAAAAALAAKSTQQQQQQALAAFPAMAASLMRQQNPAQYLLDMIPQAAKQQQQQQHHHHHSK